MLLQFGMIEISLPRNPQRGASGSARTRHMERRRRWRFSRKRDHVSHLANSTAEAVGPPALVIVLHCCFSVSSARSRKLGILPPHLFRQQPEFRFLLLQLRPGIVAQFD